VRWTPRHAVAAKRLRSVLKANIVARDRTLEQKISDAGPSPQRIDPHILTEARASLKSAGIIVELQAEGIPWYALATTDPAICDFRLQELAAVHRQTRDITLLIGEALEVAVFRSLLGQRKLRFFGHFNDLDQHDDSTLYSKTEPPSRISGDSIPGKKQLDFIVVDDEGTFGGIEVKNIRQWLYPNRLEFKELILKCCALNIVPVMIARRIHYSSFSVLNPCGVVLHQTFNQLYPASKPDIAALARHKDSLGFHDVRCSGAPDAVSLHQRLDKFLHVNLPEILSEARSSFVEYKDLLHDFATDKLSYNAFAARVKRRARGENEDFPD